MKIQSHTNSHEPEFQLEGNIIYLTEIRRPSGNEQVKHLRRFVVAQKGQQWKIRTTNCIKDGVMDGIEYDEMGCDGAKIYELKSFDKNNPGISNVKNIITAQGRVRHGNTPAIFDTDFFYPLWMAFCSSDYFLSRKDNHIAAPPFSTRNFFTETNPQTLSLSAKWKLNESNFISGIIWHSEGKHPHKDDSGSRLETFSPPFDVGFLHARFETTDWISFSEMLMPNSFVLNVFGPQLPENGEAKCILSYTVEAKVKAVHSLRDFSFIPELTKKTRITDTHYRLVSPCCGHPTYAGLAWMTEEEVEAKNKSLGIKYEK